MNAVVDIRCPECGRWLSETNGYGRAVCPNCGWEVTLRSKEERQLAGPTALGAVGQSGTTDGPHGKVGLTNP